MSDKKLAADHERMRESVFGSMPPGYYDSMPSGIRELVDAVIENCFYYHRSEKLKLFLDMCTDNESQEASL